MRSWPTRGRKSARIEIIPMIDVMMFLLVFFVLLSLNALPSKGLKVALPYAAAPTPLDVPKRVTVTLTEDGELYLDGQRTNSSELTEKLQDIARTNKVSVIIAGDRDARLQPIVGVLDAVKRAGIGSVAIIARHE